MNNTQPGSRISMALNRANDMGTDGLIEMLNQRITDLEAELYTANKLLQESGIV